MKKKLLFFLLTVVCTLLCAPPQAFAYSFGANHSVWVEGSGFTLNGEKASWTENPGDKMKMTWVDDHYEAKITTTSTSVSFKFYINNKGSWDDERSPESAAEMSSSSNYANLTWSENFNSKSKNTISYSALTQGKEYVIYLKAGDNTDVAKYAFAPAPSDDETTYTVKADISRLVADNNTLWSTSNIRCHFKSGNTGLTTWPGIEGASVSGNVITFTFTSSTKPTMVIFNNGQRNGSNQTNNLNFVDNKTYYLNWNGFNENVVQYTPTTPKVVTPSFSPEGGTVESGTEVTISCTTEGASIYYTTDGSTPTTSSTLYSDTNKPVVTADSKTIKAIAVKDGMTNSDVRTVTYSIATTPTGDLNIAFVGSGFSYLLADGAYKAANFNKAYESMTWDETNQRYYTTIKTSGESIQYKFFTPDNKKWYKPDGTTGVAVSTTTSLTWSAEFDGDSSDNISLGGLSSTYEYIVYLKQTTSGKYQYAIYRKPLESVVYNCALDMSQMGDRIWNGSSVKVLLKNGDQSADATGTVEGYHVRFSVPCSFTPTKVQFNSGAANPTNLYKTADFDFVNNKTYLIKYDATQSGAKWILGNEEEVQQHVNLPYGPKDFSQPKYFLVGARMGNWHLQPEWELIRQGNTNTYKVKGGRYIYRTNFAIAKVNTYSGYVNHQYEVISKIGSPTYVTSSAKTVTGMAVVDEKFYWNNYDIIYNPASTNEKTAAAGLAMTFCYNGAYKDNTNDNDATNNKNLSRDDKGTWAKSITLTQNGTSYSIAFDIDNSDPVNIKDRVFTLVGSDIKHVGYESQHSTPIKNGISGWQESWIQYDDNGEPYYDGEGNYLYHTAFTPEIFADNQVKFQLTVNGKKFDYSSDNIKFVEYTKLSDLKNDPYREFYKFFDGPKAISKGMEVKGGVKTDNTDFAFKVGDIEKEYTEEETDWKVFVVRDAWISDQFKIWNGWTGNTRKVEGFGDESTAARWNKLNAGPKGVKVNDKNRPQPVTMTYINAGLDGDAQIMEKLAVNEGEDSNYKVDGLTYYNRIILLYNTKQENAMANSYVMYIQDDCQPVIKGYANDDRTAYAEWNLVNVKPNSAAKITGYTITRYTVTNEGNINPKVVATAKDLEGDAWKVNALESVSDNTTVNEQNALNPGTYFYNIKVTYVGSDGETDIREASSNRFVVYGDIVSPQLRVEQLISLSKPGFEAIMNGTNAKNDTNTYTGLKERFTETFGTGLQYKSDTYYLTYRDGSEEADYYAIYTAVDLLDENGNPTNQDITYMTEVPAQEVINLMKEPSYYKWTARFYVRALNLTQFNRYYDRQNVTYENPTISLTDQAAADLTKEMKETQGFADWETQSVGIGTTIYKTQNLDGSTTEYIGSIVDRAGFLGAGAMIANMEYTYGTENKKAETEESIDFQPVVPMPYGLSARYEYRTVTLGNPIREYLESQGETKFSNDFKAYLKLKTHSAYKHADTNESGVATQDADVPYDILVDETAITNERHLDCVIEFTRPNVSEAIFNHYNVYYTIHAKSVKSDDATPVDEQNYKFTEIKGTYYDDSEIELDNDGNRILDKNGDPLRAPYQFRINNTHPSGKIYPEFQINSVVYKRADDFGGEKYIIEPTYSYDNLYVARKNTAQATMEPDKFGLGFNPVTDKDGNAKDPRWYLYGHTDMNYTNTSPSLDVDPTEFEETKLFLLELTNKAGVTVPGQTLWIHDHNLTTQNEIGNDTWRVEKEPFFINTLAVESGEVPQLTLTPIYLFIRGLEGEAYADENNVEIRDLKLYEPSNSSNAKRRNAKRYGVKRRAGETEPAAKPAPTFKIKNPVAVTKADDDTVLGANYDATNHDELVVSPGTFVTIDNNDSPIMTGIEDVKTDGAAVAGEAVYYNLQGIQVANPVKGQIYIRKAGNVSETIVY